MAKYANIQLLGPPNSGTNLMSRIINYGLTTKINMKSSGGTHIDKHTISKKGLAEKTKNYKNTLFICMYRPMQTWIDSLKNTPTEIIWSGNTEHPCIFRDKTFKTIYHLHKEFYDIYRDLSDKYKHVIFIEYNLLIDKEISFQYLTHKFTNTGLKLKPNEKIKMILSKPTKKEGKTCDDVISYIRMLEQNGIEQKYLYDPDTKEYFEEGYM